MIASWACWSRTGHSFPNQNARHYSSDNRGCTTLACLPLQLIQQLFIPNSSFYRLQQHWENFLRAAAAEQPTVSLPSLQVHSTTQAKHRFSIYSSDLTLYIVEALR